MARCKSALASLRKIRSERRGRDIAMLEVSSCRLCNKMRGVAYEYRTKAGSIDKDCLTAFGGLPQFSPIKTG